MKRTEAEARVYLLLALSKHTWEHLPEADRNAATDAWVTRKDQEELKLFINEVMAYPDKSHKRFAAWRP
jgi:hypothetical protein